MTITAVTLRDPEVRHALDIFLRMLSEFFTDDLASVVLYGSITFDDLAPGYSDLDFLVVVSNDLTDEVQEQLVDLRKHFRSGELGVYAQMLEGAFLPRAMLEPDTCGRSLWWGTSGERRWDRNRLGWLVTEVIRRYGVVIWGEDIRGEMPEVSQEGIISDIGNFVTSMRQHAKSGDLHSVDWILTAARELLLLREGKFSSKSEAAGWASKNASGSWRELLAQSKFIRLHPAAVGDPDTAAWLLTLDEAFAQAAEELERELGRFLQRDKLVCHPPKESST